MLEPPIDFAALRGRDFRWARLLLLANACLEPLNRMQFCVVRCSLTVDEMEGYGYETDTGEYYEWNDEERHKVSYLCYLFIRDRLYWLYFISSRLLFLCVVDRANIAVMTNYLHVSLTYS